MSQTEARLAAATPHPMPPTAATTTARLLRAAADLVESVQGAPGLYVAVGSHETVTVQVYDGDDQLLLATVDALATLLGIPLGEDFAVEGGVHYRATGQVGGAWWTVFAAMSPRYTADHLDGAA